MSKASKPKEIPQELQVFVDARGKPAIFLFIKESLDTEHVLLVQMALGRTKFEELDLVIFSGGGSIDAAFQIAELLRIHAKKVNACVPFFAKSAATLLCISADEIILDELAQLGPLDAQVFEGKHGGGKGKYVSALNPFKALEQLQSYSIQTMMVVYGMIDRASELSPDECFKHAVDFVKATSAPMFSQLNPTKLGEYSRALNVGKEYGERLLRRFSKFEEKKRGEILEKLVHGYPSHDYIIDHQELRELGFEAKLFSEAECKAAEPLVNLFISKRHVIECVQPSGNKPATEVSSEATSGGKK